MGSIKYYKLKNVDGVFLVYFFDYDKSKLSEVTLRLSSVMLT